jgi:hypothetical protein
LVDRNAMAQIAVKINLFIFFLEIVFVKLFQDYNSEK